MYIIGLMSGIHLSHEKFAFIDIEHGKCNLMVFMTMYHFVYMALSDIKTYRYSLVKHHS